MNLFVVTVKCLQLAFLYALLSVLKPLPLVFMGILYSGPSWFLSPEKTFWWLQPQGIHSLLSCIGLFHLLFSLHMLAWILIYLFMSSFCFPVTFLRPLRNGYESLNLLSMETVYQIFSTENMHTWSDKLFFGYRCILGYAICTLLSIGISSTMMIYETKYLKLWHSLKNFFGSTWLLSV